MDEFIYRSGKLAGETQVMVWLLGHDPKDEENG